MQAHVAPAPSGDPEVQQLALALRKRAPSDAFLLLEGLDERLVAAALAELEGGARRALLERFPEAQRERLGTLDERLQTSAPRISDFPDDSVGHLMTPPVAVFPLGTTVETVVGQIRELASQRLVTYAYVVDGEQHLRGLVTMRDLLLATPQVRVEDIMLGQPFCLSPEMKLEQAMRDTARRHYPLYPVCDGQGRLIGTVPGSVLFEALTYEISAQSGRMVGVDSHERLLTPWPESLRLRHPWLQVNLITSLAVGFIISLFNATLSQLVVLTAFLPILSSVAGNIGCQTLVVTLRGYALNEFQDGTAGKLLRKELLLGTLNGALIGAVAGLIMYFYGISQNSGDPVKLGLVVLLSMTGACLTGGLAGVAVPSVLRRFGADPATASSIFLTVITDLVGMSLFLGAATLFLL